jgi:predicted dehydrogenase
LWNVTAKTHVSTKESAQMTVALIGCGLIARFHADALEKAGATVRYVCDVNAEAAKPFVERFGAKYIADYREALQDEAVQVVDVTTITPLHHPICLAAIGAGKAVICEKTLAVNADEAWEIVQAAEKAGTIFYTSYMKRFIPAAQKMKELLPSVGRIIATHARAYQHWGNLWQPNPEPPTAEKPSVTRAKNGGGILVCGGSHILDLLCFLLGRPSRAYARIYTPTDRDIDLHAAALLETLENGVIHFDAIAHALPRTGFHRDGWDEVVEIVGTTGKLTLYSALWSQVAWKSSVLLHEDATTGTMTEYRFPAASPFDVALAFFLKNIEDGVQGSQSRTTGYAVDEIITTLLRSSETGAALDIVYRI